MRTTRHNLLSQYYSMATSKFALFQVALSLSFLVSLFFFIAHNNTSQQEPLDLIITDEGSNENDNRIVSIEDYNYWNGSFDGFDNVTGADRFIVPNIIHFIRFNQPEYLFIDYVVIKAAMKNHRPDYFFIHTDVPGPGNFTGRYWNLIQNDYELWSRIRLLHLEVPSDIFGQKLNKGNYQHGSDIERIRILQKYGGIYLDNDVYVVQNLDKYRKFECAINWQRNKKELGNQVIIANNSSRFLSLWLESYREYNPSGWYYNAGEKPVTQILKPHPELIHRVEGRFNCDVTTAGKIYNEMNYNWRRLDTTHLLIRWRSTGIIDQHYDEVKEFTEENIKTYKYPFGQMAREALDNSPGSDAVLD